MQNVDLHMLLTILNQWILDLLVFAWYFEEMAGYNPVQPAEMVLNPDAAATCFSVYTATN